ncbi:MAG: response regulator transcription factor [Chloroflexi bacterium]|nr:response regulator transcription factor [Chloroflexota bacterium]
MAQLGARGLADRQIAQVLEPAEGTARVQVEGVLAKVDLDSRARLPAWASERGMLSG